MCELVLLALQPLSTGPPAAPQHQLHPRAGRVGSAHSQLAVLVGLPLLGISYTVVWIHAA